MINDDYSPCVCCRVRVRERETRTIFAGVERNSVECQREGDLITEKYNHISVSHFISEKNFFLFDFK
jgi:hypothetical protein